MNGLTYLLRITLIKLSPQAGKTALSTSPARHVHIERDSRKRTRSGSLLADIPNRSGEPVEIVFDDGASEEPTAILSHSHFPTEEEVVVCLQVAREICRAGHVVFDTEIVECVGEWLEKLPRFGCWNAWAGEGG